MALKLVNGNEIRVPGRAIPVAQCREGILGKLDGMSLNEFRKMPLADRTGLIQLGRCYYGDQERNKRYFDGTAAYRREMDRHRTPAALCVDVEEVRAFIEGRDTKKTITSAVICTINDEGLRAQYEKAKAKGTYNEIARAKKGANWFHGVEKNYVEYNYLLRLEYPAVISDSKSLMTLVVLPQLLPDHGSMFFNEVKYIALKEKDKEDGKCFIVAMPTQITKYHRDIFHIMNKALGYEIGALECLGGGKVKVTNNNGKVTIEGKSDDYGVCQMDVTKPINDLLDGKLPELIALCREKGFADLERELVAISRKKIRK